MYDRIALYLPTYKRCEKLKKCIDSAIAKADKKQRIDFCFLVNTSDTDTYAFIRNYPWPDGVGHELLQENTRQPNLAFYYNYIFDNTAFYADTTVVSMLGDDMVFSTHSWDTRILEEVNKKDGEVIIHVDDGYIARGRMAVNLFTTRKIVSATDRPYMCPAFHADMIDVVWYIVGQLSSTLVYLGDVVLMHEHETKKIDPMTRDETHQRLAPIQQVTNSKDNQRYALAYGTIAAANVINSGIGKWNIISSGTEIKTSREGGK